MMHSTNHAPSVAADGQPVLTFRTSGLPGAATPSPFASSGGLPTPLRVACAATGYCQHSLDCLPHSFGKRPPASHLFSCCAQHRHGRAQLLAVSSGRGSPKWATRAPPYSHLLKYLWFRKIFISSSRTACASPRTPPRPGLVARRRPVRGTKEGRRRENTVE
jgi:hypothetical protein